MVSPQMVLIAAVVALTLFIGEEAVTGIKHVAHGVTHAVHKVLHPHEVAAPPPPND